jgi:hypothetical protein
LIADDRGIDDYTLLLFPIPCDTDGNPTGGHEFDLNAKSGDTYNHEKLWDGEIKGKTEHKPYCKKPFNYYPRGRVEIANNKATIYLNPHINKAEIVAEIKTRCGLDDSSIGEVRVVADGSGHYRCWMDER